MSAITTMHQHSKTIIFRLLTHSILSAIHLVTPKYQSSWFRISSPARSSSLSLDSSNQVMILPVAVTGFSPLKIKSGIGSLGQDIFILMMSTPFSRWNHNCKLQTNKWVCDAKEFDILTNTGRFSS